MNRHARFTVVDTTADSITLMDLGPWDEHPTITNDAEWVVEQVAHLLEDGKRRLYYVDSEQMLTELKVENGRFAGFLPCAKGTWLPEGGL